MNFGAARFLTLIDKLYFLSNKRTKNNGICIKMEIEVNIKSYRRIKGKAPLSPFPKSLLFSEERDSTIT